LTSRVSLNQLLRHPGRQVGNLERDGSLETEYLVEH
jgi:hypothetical protein